MWVFVKRLTVKPRQRLMVIWGILIPQIVLLLDLLKGCIKVKSSNITAIAWISMNFFITNFVAHRISSETRLACTVLCSLHEKLFLHLNIDEPSKEHPMCKGYKLQYLTNNSKSLSAYSRSSEQ